MMMMKNQNTQEASLTTTRLSPLAKPFTFNPSSSTSPFLFDASHSHFDVAGGGGGFGYGKQGLDSLESLFGIGNDVVADTTIFHKGKHAVDGLNPHLTVSDDVFKKSTGTIVAEDIPSNSTGTIHATDESGSFPLSNCKVAPLKLSTTNMSSAKNTPQNQSSKNLGESDSDVDSPCWKGTMAFCQTPNEISGSIEVCNVEKATEKNNSLNPLAPQFFPGIGYIQDDFGSSNSCVPVATNLLSAEDMLMNPVTAESPVELNKGIELLHSGNTCGIEKTFNMLSDPKSSSVDPALKLPYMMMPSSSIEESLTSKGKLETIVDVDDFRKGTKDPGVSRSISEVFPTKDHFPISIPTPTTSSSQVSVVTGLLKTFEGVSKSLIESPRPDVGRMINAMHVLSELLVQTCMDGGDSCNERGHEVIMIQEIINNLNDFCTKKCGQNIPTLDPTPVNSSFRSLDLPKGLELTSVESLNVPHQLHPQHDYMGKNKVIKMVGQRGQSFLASSSDEDQYKGKEIAELQVIRRNLGKTLDFNKQMPSEALLFRNLWLDSEAERCYRKYKTYHCLMEAGVGVNSANVAELLR